MPRVDATRITWFLGLQRILRLPGFSLAPTTVSRYRGRRADQASETAGGYPTRFPHAAAAAARVRYPVRRPIGGDGRKAGSVDEPKAVTTPSLMTKIVGERPALRAPIRVGVRPGPPDRSQAIFGRNIGVKSLAGVQIPDLGNNPPGRMNFVRASSRSEKPARLAPPLQLAPTPLVPPDRKEEPAPRFATRGTDISLRRHNTISAGERFLPESSVIDDQSLLPHDPVTAAGGGNQRSKPGVSTLHIDGSALGRWTIQHLERALNKPATGITGIDPRAAAPRSRVAPF